jgi:tetrahydromethanopterin S-methyltransferase subunit G
MSEDRTANLPTNHPFEERVMMLLSGIDSRLANIESRLEALESRQYNTKPIWERALNEIAETRVEMNEKFEGVNERLDSVDRRIAVLAGDVIKVRAREIPTRRPAKKRA